MIRVQPVVLSLAMICLGCPLLATEALAQWSIDPNVNNPICTTVTRQLSHNVVSDGAGGAIISWVDFDLMTGSYDIRAQRITSGGIVQWAAGGLAVCTNPALQTTPAMIADGSGGAFIVWQDNRNAAADIYAQRINGSGVAQWTADGLPVCSATNDQTSPQLTSDGSGGAIVTWQDLRGGVNYVPYAQRLDANGVPQWTPDGVLLSATGIAETPQIVSDGSGGGIVAWHQYSAGQFDIYAQRITADGSVAWGSSGTAVCTQSGNQLRPRLTVDAPDGVVLAWEDYRNTSYSIVYAQRLGSTGAAQWSANGVPVAPNTLDQRDPRILSDGAGGAFVVWRYGTNEIFAQRLGAAGSRLWASDGVGIGRASNSYSPVIATDGGTGAIIAWYDYRSSGNGDVFAQRVDANGDVLWATNGVGVCRNSGAQVAPQLLADGWGGAILAWIDGRNSATSDDDLYGQKIDAAGGVGGFVSVDDTPAPSTGLLLGQNHPNPCHAATTIEWRMPARGFASVTLYDLSGREVSTLASEELEPGIHSRQWNTTRLAGGVYYYQLRVGSVVQSKKVVVVK